MARPAQTEFNFPSFHRRRKFLKIGGIALVLLGLFTIVDMMSEIPIPLTGARAVFVGLLLMVFGLVSLYNGYKLPLAEAIELIHGRQRGITASELVHLMRVDRLTADRIIQRLIGKGFLRSSSDRTQAEEVFDPVQ